MAYDGITVAAVTEELNRKLTGGRVYRIAQPENDAVVLTVRAQSGQYRLLLSADASLPLVYLTEENRKNPLNAPGFCMLLRKYIQNAKILSVTQPGLERVIRIEMEHMDEMGDMRKLCLITEIMGKHSNVILTDDKDEIIDSIKRISNLVSSVREVLPGRKYFIPETRGRIDPAAVKDGGYLDMPEMANMPVHKALTTYIGISNTAASEFIRVAGADGDRIVSELDPDEKERIEKVFSSAMERIRTGDFSPVVYYNDGIPAEYAAIDTGMYPEKKTGYEMSETLELFYREKELHVRIRQRSTELRRAVQNATERVAKKLGIQEKQCRDTEKREKNKLYGELIRAYAYQIEEGADKCILQDYNTGEDVSISLDPTLSTQDNANKYFDKYKKQKRTFEALSVYIQQSVKELEHLESIQVALDMAQNEDDLTEIRRELSEAGYISAEKGTGSRGTHGKNKGKNTGAKSKGLCSAPLHYVTEDGHHIYVGKNNHQNDYITFELANGGDMWFHAKKIPGSHVVVKTEGAELPDSVYEIAAAVAAYYSKAGSQGKVDVDYTVRKNLKKTPGGAPGFVIYHTNYSMTVKPSLAGVKLAEG